MIDTAQMATFLVSNLKLRMDSREICLRDDPLVLVRVWEGITNERVMTVVGPDDTVFKKRASTSESMRDERV